MASNARETGTVRVWNSSRGYGFLTRPDGSDLFLHIKAFPRDTPDPEIGTRVSYVVETQADGKLRAARAGTDTQPFIPPIRPTSPILGALAILAFAAIYVLVDLTWGPVPLWVLFAYVGVSIITFGAYVLDKSAARSQRRRVAETSLILLGMFGGWPGAILAQQLFRHKTAKLSFRAVFWVSVLINVFVFVTLNAPLTELATP
jgi:uncharacterized membrane protein YsdA (DUF1294 family)/cold shock CspA family protein